MAFEGLFCVMVMIGISEDSRASPRMVQIGSARLLRQEWIGQSDVFESEYFLDIGGFI